MQIDTRPRFRQDLVAEPVEDNGARFIDLMDPDSGNVFRFYEVEYSLACAMDGERDIAGIVQWAKEELGLVPSPKEVQTVIATLGELGYLDRGAAKPAELAKGVVAGAKKPAAASIDVELGHATPKAAPAADLPKAPELELGAPGTAAPRDLDLPKAEDIALGASGRREPAKPQVSEVSIDLSAHVPVKPDDVKEAVRASQVMRAVDVPPELMEAAEPKVEVKPEPKVEVKPESKVEVKPESKVEKRADATPAPKKPEAEKRADATPAPKKPEPRPEPKPAVPPPAAARRTSPVLVLLLVLVVVAAGAFVAWKYLLKKDTAAEQPPPQAKVEPPKPVLPPPPPPPETAKLAVEQPEPQDLKPTTVGQIESIVANDTEVKAGDVVAKLAGHKPLETEVAAIQRDIDKRVQPELAQAEKDRDAAQAAGNKAGVTAAEARITDRTKSLEDKQGKLAAKTAELDKFLIKSPVDGKVTAVAKANARVTPSDVVAKIVRAPVLTATLHPTTELAPNTKVFLAAGDQKLQCTAVEQTSGATKFVCPSGAAKEGTEVSFAGIDTAAGDAGSGAEIEMGEPEGSAAGSAAPATGSAAGSATAGSATKAATPAPHPARPASRPHPQPKAPTPPAGSDTSTTPAPADQPAPSGSATP